MYALREISYLSNLVEAKGENTLYKIMPVRNVAGGKNFKKGRKIREDDDGPSSKFVGRNEGQDYARVIRAVGNRRFTCFCNDGVERICKVRGTLCWGPRKVRIDAADIIIFSLREFDTDSGGDIIAKIPQKFWKEIQKEEGIHSHLFTATAGGESGQGDIVFEDSESEEEADDANVDVDAI